MRLRVGTSGYNFPEWKGSFYPPKLPSAKWLEYYAQQLGTVEINYTFYRMPNAKTVAGWDAATPAEFTFVLKVPQRITHIARLKNIDEPLRVFLDTVRKLHAKLGPVLFQLPPNFKKDVERLGDLLTQFPSDMRAACEFRHASWWSDDVYELLRSTNTALCVADTEAGTTPLEATADFGYVRLRDEGYGPAALEGWRQKVQDLGKSWTDAFVFFKHEEKGMGPKLAAEFLALADTAHPPTPESGRKSPAEK
ncbi:MAG: DUF72 domain-containing protein [Gemmatimonadales bacterium]